MKRFFYFARRCTLIYANKRHIIRENERTSAGEICFCAKLGRKESRVRQASTALPQICGKAVEAGWFITEFLPFRRSCPALKRP
jgi:hypothetical protein